MLFRKAYLSEAEWANDVADCEHHIMVLQSKLSENYEVQMMLELTAGQLSDAQKNWHDASSVDRQAFAHNLFEEIIYDLDTRRITGFKLKPWAESFLQLRVGIAEMYGENPANPTSELLYTPVHPEGYCTTRLPSSFTGSWYLEKKFCAEFMDAFSLVQSQSKNLRVTLRFTNAS